MDKIKNFNRLNDVYFKNLLTDEHNKQITICFLNDILEREGNQIFTDICFLDKENMPNIEAGKVSILDIRAKTNDNTEINIEVQVRPRKDMAKRSLYYWSKIYSSQLMKGENYINLNNTIAINLLDFSILPYKTCHNVYHITNDETHDRLLDDLEMHFIELNKFTLGDIKRLRKSEKWLALFANNCTNEEMEEIAMTEPAIKMALEYEKYFRENPELRREYELREMAELDRRSELDLNRQEGIREGIREGEYQKSIKIAKKMLYRGNSIEDIADITELSISDIEQLKAMLNI